jgi:hypothetical protein
MVSYKRFRRMEAGCEMPPAYVTIHRPFNVHSKRELQFQGNLQIAASGRARLISEGSHRRIMFFVLGEGTK